VFGRFVATVALLLLAVAGVDTAPVVTAWINGHWFDGSAFNRLDVFSVDDRLALKRPDHVDRTVDLAGGFVTGAFAEAHTHQVTSGDADASIRTYLRQGIFYVMSQMNVPQARETLGARVNIPTSVDVAVANGGFTAPGGHPSALVRRNIQQGGMTEADLTNGFIHAVASTDDVDRAWTYVQRERPDFVKIVLVYSEDRVAAVPRPTDNDRHGLDPSLVPHIVERAHRDNLRVSAHVESAYDFDVAVRGGADIIAHMPGFWPDEKRIAAKGMDVYRIGEDSAKRGGAAKTRLITTIYETLKTVNERPEYAAVRQPVLDLLRHNIKVLTDAGVVIAMGSDQFRTSSVAEALEIHKAGLMPSAALLRALSMDGAATIFPSGAPFGLVDGARADFLVLEANPLTDFTAIERIRTRVKAGRELSF